MPKNLNSPNDAGNDSRNEGSPETTGGLAKDPMRRTAMQQVAEYSQIGFVLPTAILVGWLAGVGLDHWMGTKWLYLAGVILGSIAGFIELVRTMLKSDTSGKSGKGGGE